MHFIVKEVNAVAEIGGDLEEVIEHAELPFDVEVPYVVVDLSQSEDECCAVASQADSWESEDEEIVAIVLDQVTEGFEELRA